VFESIDKNHDGVISKEEFEDAYGTKIVTPPNSPGRERPSGNNVAQRAPTIGAARQAKTQRVAASSRNNRSTASSSRHTRLGSQQSTIYADADIRQGARTILPSLVIHGHLPLVDRSRSHVGPNPSNSGVPERESWIHIAKRDPPPWPERDPREPRMARSISPTRSQVASEGPQRPQEGPHGQQQQKPKGTDTQRAQDITGTDAWEDPLRREPWMHIARRDPPPGFNSVDFDPAERERRSKSPPHRANRTKPSLSCTAGPPSLTGSSTSRASKPDPTLPWNRHTFSIREPWERESWMAIAQRDPPPLEYSVYVKTEPSPEQEARQAKLDEAKRRVDARLAEAQPGRKPPRSTAPPLPKHLQRESWQSIASRDPPPFENRASTARKSTTSPNRVYRSTA